MRCAIEPQRGCRRGYWGCLPDLDRFESRGGAGFVVGGFWTGDGLSEQAEHTQRPLRLKRHYQTLLAII